MAYATLISTGIGIAVAVVDIYSTFAYDDPYSQQKNYKLGVDIYNLELQINQTVTEILQKTNFLVVSDIFESLCVSTSPLHHRTTHISFCLPVYVPILHRTGQHLCD